MIYSFVVSFALGIFFEQVFNFGWSTGVLIFFVSIVISVFLWKERVLGAAKIFLIIGIAFGIGVLRMSFVDVSPDQNLYSALGENINFEAVVSDEPDARDASTRYTVKIADSKSSIILVAGRFPELEYGDQIKVSGKLELPKNFLSREAGAKRDGVEFDYVNYLSKDRIHFIVYRPQIEKTGEERAILGSLYSLKNIFIEKISEVVPEPNSSFLSGIIFGAKQSLGPDLLESFKKVGLIHIVVLSGYNITIIAAGVFYVTSVFGKRNLGFAASAVLIILFGIMVGLGATVVRAIIMALISILALFLGRPADALRWLFIAGMIMLLWNPLILFHDPSFQLSFMATLGLIIFSSAVDQKIISPLIRVLIKIGVSVAVISSAEKLKMREIISSTLAVQIFVLPLLIKMSGQFSIISFFVNPLLLPLVPYAMGLGALTGALGMLPFGGHILSWPLGIISYLLTQIIIFVTEISARIPLSAMQTGGISIWLILVWYAFYAFIFLKLKSKIIAQA